MTTLLAPDDIRPFTETDLDDDSLQLLIDAADAEIIRFAGELGSLEEWFGGGSRVIALARQAGSITSIVETDDWSGRNPVTLAADDYLIDPAGYLLYRINTGTNPRWRWWGRIVVTYSPVDEEAIRKGVELDLVRLMESYEPGLSSETVGSWTTQLSSNSAWNNSKERASILSRLVVHGRMLVVGG